jgi:hypothetical protein
VTLRRPLALLVLLPAAAAGGQEVHEHEPRGWLFAATAQVIPLLTRATPTAERRSLTEGYLAQPIVAARVSGFGGRVAALGMLNLEGATLARGELNTGTYGEGFVDRRHPHSYLHELMAVVSTTIHVAGRPVAISVAGGRGFAPFGSDDPMARPFAKYPVNHHLAQILERLVLIAAARVGPLTLEGGIFNGDEPTTPRSVPLWSRFADSWSARMTLRPTQGVELAASAARVESPEFREGRGLDQRKRSIVLRLDRPPAAGGPRPGYLLAEWARTHDDRRGRQVFTYTSFLAEGASCGRSVWGALRFERTTRPEEERLLDPFRTPRPQIELAILGRSRWTALTAAIGTKTARVGVFHLAPFAEATYARAESVEQLAAFVPREFYGSEQVWLLSVGARVNLGGRHHRMGRYGVAGEAERAASRGHGGAAQPVRC